MLLKGKEGSCMKSLSPRMVFFCTGTSHCKQPEAVREALRKIGIDTDEAAMREFDDALLSALMEDGDTNLPKQPRDPDGEAVYEQIARAHKLPDVGSGWDVVSGDHDQSTWSGHKKASMMLNELGVKGIKYLDGSSRSKGDGSYNYVIFDDYLS